MTGRRCLRLVSVLGIASAVVAPGISAAQAAGDLPIDVRVEENTTVARRIPQYVPVTVTIVDHATQASPSADYNVYALAENPAGERTQTSSCGQRSDNNPGVPNGIYDCTVIVDHGGRWTVVGVVNDVTIGAEPSRQIVKATTDVTVNAGALAGTAPKPIDVKGRVTDVTVLWLHSVVAALWFAAVGAFALLAFSGLRQRLSPLGIHRIEDRLGTLTRALFATTVLVVGTGVYLLVKQTAYQTPWSPSAARAVARLPYGKPYFLALAVKLAVYAAMVAASVAVSREAIGRSTLRLDDATAGPAPVTRRRAASGPSPWDDLPPPRRSGGTLVEERPAESLTRRSQPLPPVRPDPPLPLRAAVVTLATGGVVIWICVTLLKYFHELVEASRAVLVR
jgi:hypothetical protein